jgi:phosphoribosyl-ATP pyrophosphohydrolase/phosphoribosyl-AMP cyclohydrolase
MTESLIPVIAQDVRTNNVLMLAWTNREALAKTRKTGRMHYWSRSRGRLWKKGEESGHGQKVRSLHYDCDRDAILARVEQTGPACHRNTYSCWAKSPFPAEEILHVLEATIADRRRKPKKGSYTNALLADPARQRDKLVEEACELAMAVKSRRKTEIAGEAADVLYHLLVLLAGAGVSLDDVRGVLERRHR